MNQIFILQPYFYNGSWVFDDANAELVREPFVNGIPEMIDFLVDHIPTAKNGFRLIFSADPFPEFQIEIKRIREEIGGYWYHHETTQQEGWLCPALFKYFKSAPERIYAKAEPLKALSTIDTVRSALVYEDELDIFMQELELGNLDGLRDMLIHLKSKLA